MKQIEMWYKATGCSPIADFEWISYQLFEAGVLTIEELDSKDLTIKEFCFYTDDKQKREEIVQKFPQCGFKLSEEPQKDWDKWWRDRAEPVHVSPHLWVVPPWVEFKPQSENDKVLILEAKTAFGTGEHETTSSCASLMEEVDFAHKRVLDIGTGTGILGMYARKMGASLAIGTEIDPLAIPCIDENFKQNGFENSHCVLGFLDIFKDDTKFDVILCNMIRSELWPMREDIENLLNKNGKLIISGQLLTEKDYILKWFQDAHLKVIKEQTKGEWWSVLAGL